MQDPLKAARLLKGQRTSVTWPLKVLSLSLGFIVFMGTFDLFEYFKARKTLKAFFRGKEFRFILKITLFHLEAMKRKSFEEDEVV